MFDLAELKLTAHDLNRTGVRASCADCNVPRESNAKMAAKLRASKDLLGHFSGNRYPGKIQHDASGHGPGRVELHEGDRLPRMPGLSQSQCDGLGRATRSRAQKAPKHAGKGAELSCGTSADASSHRRTCLEYLRSMRRYLRMLPHFGRSGVGPLGMEHPPASARSRPS